MNRLPRSPQVEASNSRVHVPRDPENHATDTEQQAAYEGSPAPGVNYGRSSFMLPQSNFPFAGGALPNWQFPANSPAQGLPFPPPPHQPMPVPPSYQSPSTYRVSGDSSATLCDSLPATNLQSSTWSSGKHAYDIEPPPGTWPRSRAFSATSSGGYSEHVEEDLEKLAEETCQLPRRRRGYLANLIDLYNLYDNTDDNAFVSKKRDSVARAANLRTRLVDPLAYDEDQLLDRDDPLVTGVRKRCLDDLDDVDQNARRQLSYKERRQEQQRVRIEFNICCKFFIGYCLMLIHGLAIVLQAIEIRQRFLMTFARALLSFGAPSHRMESQLLAVARILEVDAEFTHIPGIVIASFGDEETKSSQMHFAKCPSRVSLGKLHKLHKIYRAVVHDEISAKKATEMLDTMLASGPMCPVWLRGIFVFCIGGLICPLAFGGSFIDMWLGGASSLFLFAIQAGIASRKSVIYANVYESAAFLSSLLPITN